ncbi:MAG: hypothetical protein COW30_09220 [Rhodospirillales bacterium CG15_BIG_FIL_POST_REV_8_21_14_020_66_15]|nr:MAG: hypothetical protein COW30_09220 [Rhodospirillales bacterium CG15_BIG_FIL_POST_REV_8_21_14_020_66_15]
MNQIDTPLRIKSVSAGKVPLTLAVVWTDGSRDVVDLSGLVARSRHFTVFADDPEAFADVGVADWGYSVEWGNGLDWPAPNLKRLADEQRSVTGADLAAWQEGAGLSNREAADVLGVDLKTVKNWRAAAFRDKPLPTAAQWSIRHLTQEPLALIAHYRPRRAGRPRKAERDKGKRTA